MASRSVGWEESTDWMEGLRKTVDWYREHGRADWWDAEAVEASLEAHPEYFASLQNPEPWLQQKDPKARLG